MPPKKAPIGIIPKGIWYKKKLEERRNDLERAIIRYAINYFEIPEKWVAELNEINNEIGLKEE